MNIIHMDDMESLYKEMAGKKEGSDKEEADKTKEEQDAGITQEEVIDYIFSKHPGLKGCYATDGDSVRAALGAIERAGSENIAVVGYDADKDELEALKEGKISGLIVQNPFGMGYASVIAAARAALSMGNEAYIDTGYTWVTKENLEDPAVEKMLY